MQTIIFDPKFSETECEVCRKLGLQVRDHNTRGKHKIGSDRKNDGFDLNDSVNTLFFMPHCPYRLYCNLLWSNWEKESLQKLFILGNR